MNNKEIRFNENAFEARNDDNNTSEEMVVEGYAAVFNSPATHGFTEVISPSAFDNCDMSDVCFKYNHDDSHLILARTRNKSLQLEVDEKGLKFKANLIDTTSNQDVYKMIKEGLLDKCSFAFTVNKEEWDLKTDTRTITDIDKLFDVSVVNNPFYDTTEIYARALDSLESERAKLESFKAEQRRARRAEIVKAIKAESED